MKTTAPDQFPRRVLVTGGAGFIASHTIELLLTHHIEVIAFDNLSSGKLSNLNLQHPGLKFIKGDILDYSALAACLAECDAVLHLAAIASVPQSIIHPLTSFQVNTHGFLQLLEALRLQKSKLPMVYASSAAVYGEGKSSACFEHDIRSDQLLSPYAMQKLHCEHYANLYSQLYDIHPLGLRYFNVYGNRQDPQSAYSGVICRFLNAYHTNQPLTVYGDGKQSRDFIHVSDIARANLAAIKNSMMMQKSEVVNIATGQAKNLLQLIECIEAAGKKTAEIQFQPRRDGDINSSYAAIEMAKEKLHFEAQLTLQDGIRLML